MLQEIVVGVLAGLGSVALLGRLIEHFLTKGLEHALNVTLQERKILGESELQYRKQQLAELYGPIYALLKTSEDVYRLWIAKSLGEINDQILHLMKEQNEMIMDILVHKAHLIDGDNMPVEFQKFMTSATIWNLHGAPGSTICARPCRRAPRGEIPWRVPGLHFRED